MSTSDENVTMVLLNHPQNWMEFRSTVWVVTPTGDLTILDENEEMRAFIPNDRWVMVGYASEIIIPDTET